MTNPTPHGQVPEALIDLIDAYAETRHRCGGIYNAKTEAVRNAVIEALSGVQALSAAPAVLSDEAILNRTGCIDYSPGTAEYDLELIRWYRTQIASPAPQQSRPLSHPNREIPGSAKGAAITSESPTPPAEQQACDTQLFKFYGVSTTAELIAAQARHIEKLQAKIPPTPSFAPQRVREG